MEEVKLAVRELPEGWLMTICKLLTSQTSEFDLQNSCIKAASDAVCLSSQYWEADPWGARLIWEDLWGLLTSWPGLLDEL